MDSVQAGALVASLQGQSVDGWSVEGYLGRGKSAVVVPATKSGNEAALKVFHPELIERFGRQVQLERIQREKTLIGQSHPNVVKILGGGECPITRHLYVAMERIPYKNLQEVLQDVPADAVPKLIAQLASAARFLEDLGLIHRDIKPENVAVSTDFSHAILLDLGVIKPLGFSDLTDVNARPFIGTLRYSSPEFLRRLEEPTLEGGRAITFYQLGAVLHDMLMKRPLFANHTEPYSKLVEAVFNERPELYGEDTRSVALAKRCLVKEPAARLQLVSWADFDLQTEEVAGLAAIQQRLQARQSYFRVDQLPRDMLASEITRAAKQRLEDAANRLSTRVATVLNASNLFPLRRISSEKDVLAQTCTATIQFESDIEFGLQHGLVVRIVLTLIDENAGNPMYQAESCWALSDAEVNGQSLSPTTKLFSGELGAFLDSSQIEQQLAGALEAAYVQQDKGLPGELKKPLVLVQG